MTRRQTRRDATREDGDRNENGVIVIQPELDAADAADAADADADADVDQRNSDLPVCDVLMKLVGRALRSASVSVCI